MTTDTARPNTVPGAAYCLWASAALVLLVTTAQITGLVANLSGTVGMAVAIGVGTAALLGVIAWYLSRGRNWARWLFAVIYVIGTLGLLAITPEAFLALPTILQANMILQFILQTVALILMFTRASNQWFKAKRATAAP